MGELLTGNLKLSEWLNEMNEGLFIFCFVPDFYPEEQFRALGRLGIKRISSGKISALVTVYPDSQVDYSDRDLLGKLVIRHQVLVEEIRAAGFIHLLPLKVGTVAGSEEDVRAILDSGHRLINETFKRMQFMTEMDLAVTWTDFPSTLRSISEDPLTYGEMPTGMASADDSVQDPELRNWVSVKSRLREISMKAELSILDNLLPISLDIKPHESMNHQMISNSAFLVNRSDIAEFREMVEALEKQYQGAMTFTLLGPLPCYSFFTIEVEELSRDKVEKANVELGLRNETSEVIIRRAYINKTKMFHPDVHLRKGEEDYFASITRAYHTLLDYSSVSRQGQKSTSNGKTGRRADGRLIIVKLKD